MVKEYKNGKITLKINKLEKEAFDRDPLAYVLDDLSWIDTYMVSEEYCIGNYYTAIDLYNVRTNKKYMFRMDFIETLKRGGTVSLGGYTPDEEELKTIEEYWRDQYE